MQHSSLSVDHVYILTKLIFVVVSTLLTFVCYLMIRTRPVCFNFLPGILQGVYWGLGGGLGAILGGVLIDEYGTVPSFRLGALMSVAVLIVGGFIQYCISYQKKNSKSQEKPDEEHIMDDF